MLATCEEFSRFQPSNDEFEQPCGIDNAQGWIRHIIQDKQIVWDLDVMDEKAGACRILGKLARDLGGDFRNEVEKVSIHIT